MQDTAENVVYAIVGPFSSCQSRTLETLKLDEDRVEYAKINYSIMPQNPTHASSDKKATDEGITITLTLSPWHATLINWEWAWESWKLVTN